MWFQRTTVTFVIYIIMPDAIWWGAAFILPADIWRCHFIIIGRYGKCLWSHATVSAARRSIIQAIFTDSSEQTSAIMNRTTTFLIVAITNAKKSFSAKNPGTNSAIQRDVFLPTEYLTLSNFIALEYDFINNYLLL